MSGSTTKNLPPRLSTCSRVAGRTSVAVTTAPIRLAMRNGLKAGDTDPHNKNLGRRYGARRCHHHRKRSANLTGGIKNGFVARQITLGRKDVHGLGPCNPGQHLHGKGCNTLFRKGISKRLLT